ncbi:PAS domain-containing hybrid sensor histidine kinase/response regulator [Methylobacterium sp. 17Sr1-1]|uniref:PAS domain-containing hybrid sensor histidine kinase/response regulator n=1 Tax=Methylobacterium sp. 17Sr1-1 TaxID=2202826 RepID=UPI000D7019C9|nr:PAS domain-containing hybrid sensor histidine kinase/response regulator [Methylobacterium sp. 17Sr1-1]AWN53355.1 hybrid sensor histidine kinase/response regulator [Methylobacterium sp. 17Sr1-1]
MSRGTDHDGCAAGWRAVFARLFGRGAAGRLVDGCPDLVAEIDGAGRLVRASPASRALTGRAPDTLAGLPLADWVHPEDRAGVAALLAGGGGALLHRLSHADGRWIWVETRLSSGGPPFVAAIRDAAARQDTEASLRASRAHYRALADTLPQLVWMERTDTGETVYANPAFERYFGAIGPGRAARQERYHPDDRARIAAALVQGALAQDGSGEGKGRLRDRDGAYRWHQLSFQPLRKDDALLGWLGSALDIDDILAARKALEETGDLLRLAQDAAGAGLFDLDLVTREVTLAPESARLHGLPADRPAVIGLGAWLRRLVPPDRKPALAAYRGAVAGGGTFDIAFRVQVPGGQRWIQAIGRLCRDRDGRALRVTGLNLDISARKDAEAGLVAAKAAAEAAKAAAERANAAKTDFLSAMSHEIRTPLNAVIGFTDLLAQAEGLAPEQRRHAGLARASAGGLLTLVNDILDFSSVEAGAVALRPEPFAIEALAEGCLGMVGAAAAEKSLAVTSTIDASLPRHLLGDEARLRQILLNLLNNAVKFTPRGSVALSLRHEGSGGSGERIRFSVSDTGIGIAPEKQGRLFERFSQVDSSIRRDYGGTGLGLAISRRLVEAMGGEIGLISASGRGATFWFTLTLPRAEDRAPPETRAAASPGRAGRLLLVEDIEVNRELACLMLRKAGHSVDVATDGFQAVRAAEAGTYDLVLMDVQMPGLDGTMATRLIRCLPGAAGRVPVVAMTANVLPDQVQSFRAAGMDDHLGKPFTPAELTALLARWLDRAPGPDAGTPEDEPALDRALYDGVCATLPPEAVRRLLGHLAEQVTGALAGEGADAEGRGRLRFEAHGLVSAAGMLGFAALSRACAEFESCTEDAVARDPAAFAMALARARVRCTAAAFETRRLIAGLEAGPSASAGLGRTA